MSSRKETKDTFKKLKCDNGTRDGKKKKTLELHKWEEKHNSLASHS